MTIATFYTDVRTVIGRGASNDASFPGWAQETINRLENARTWAWMQRAQTVALTQGVNSNIVDLSGLNVKSFEWVRYGETQGSGAQQTVLLGEPLAIVNPIDVESSDYGMATGGYLDGVTSLVLDARADQAYSLFMRYNAYTVWPTDTSQTPAILARHYAGFKSQFMVTAAANLRNPDLGQVWGPLASQDYAAMEAADEQLRMRAMRNLRMGGSAR